MKPWEEYWYVVQVPDVPAMLEFRGQWNVYHASRKIGSEGSQLFGYKGGPVAEGDARLAAAAPELFRALEALLEACEDDLQHWEGSPRGIGENETKRRVILAINALQKARGET